MPTGIDLNQVLFPVLVTIRNDSSLEDLNSNNVEIYLPEMDEIKQVMINGTIDYQKIKSISAKDDDPIGIPIENSVEQKLPVASIAFAKGVAINVLGAGLKSFFIKIRKKDSLGYRGFRGDHGTHLNLVKAGTYVILMSVALYLELQQGFQRADLLTTWSNAGISLMTVGIHILRHKKKAMTNSMWTAFFNTTAAIIITSVSPDTSNYHPKIVSTWCATADQISAFSTKLKKCCCTDSKSNNEQPYRIGMVGAHFLVTSFSIVTSSWTTAQIVSNSD
ncbi:hypothetical protein [Cardinium endosymbiont of Culicoides punctatus]|uniref:hypothetical protein n=1 Tax=Cardinium endosymbiont of Culicoides punctatus TaxID=2304601 RepID=UPI0010590D44|nr:hypothetical protein [Cardinium endosymbiont of Culicoides punctatus]TDG94665.1 hypothetical protein CCPUN_07610 [Cardinium endosymbiont of Culicoides punctatus]